MSNDNTLSLPELNDRIAILEGNIRQLVEQAAGSSGARDEERISDRIAQQNEQLGKLIKARDDFAEVTMRVTPKRRVALDPR